MYEELEAIYASYINGQFRQMCRQISEYGSDRFFYDFEEFVREFVHERHQFLEFASVVKHWSSFVNPSN